MKHPRFSDSQILLGQYNSARLPVSLIFAAIGMREICRRHWLAVGERYIGVAPTTAILEELPGIVEGAITLVQEKIPEGFPAHVVDTIVNDIRSNLAHLAL